MNYFYIIQEEGTGKLYAGSRTARDAHPSDLLSTYFTSSSTVESLIEEGSRFSILKIRVREDALDYEGRFLRRVNADLNPKFLNLHKGNTESNFSSADYISVKSIKTGRCFRIHKDDPRVGKEFVGVNRGRVQSDEEKRKKQKLIDFNGKSYTTREFLDKFKCGLPVAKYVREFGVFPPKKENRGNKKRPVIEGVKYDSYKQASDTLGIPWSVLKRYELTGKFLEGISNQDYLNPKKRKEHRQQMSRDNGSLSRGRGKKGRKDNGL